MSTQEEVKGFLSEDEKTKFLDALDKTGDLDFVGASKTAKVDYYTQVLQEIQTNAVFKSKVMAYIEGLRSQMINAMYCTATGKTKGKGCNGAMCKQVISLIDSGEVFKGVNTAPAPAEKTSAIPDVLATFKKELNLSGGADGETEDDDGF